MTYQKDTIHIIAPFLKPYIDLHRLSGEQYYFRKESSKILDASGNKRVFFPKIEHSLAGDFHSPNESILYAAFPAKADLNNLENDDLLYIGCCEKGCARFWRGKKDATTRFTTPRSCFHHNSMRGGRDGNTIETFLTHSGAVRIYTLTSIEIEKLVLSFNIQLPTGKYPAHQLEKKILSEGFKKWKWNGRS